MLGKWTGKWLMPFNGDKCKALHIDKLQALTQQAGVT